MFRRNIQVCRRSSWEYFLKPGGAVAFFLPRHCRGIISGPGSATQSVRCRRTYRPGCCVSPSSHSFTASAIVHLERQRGSIIIVFSLSVYNTKWHIFKNDFWVKIMTVLSHKAYDDLKGMNQHKARAALSMLNLIAWMVSWEEHEGIVQRMYKRLSKSFE